MPANFSFQHLDLQEGMQVNFKEDHPITLLEMFSLMAFASAAFESRPVLCIQFLPKLDIRLSLGGPLVNDEVALKQAWNKIQITLLTWLDQIPVEMNGKISQSGFDLELFQAGCPHDGVVTFTRSWKLN